MTQTCTAFQGDRRLARGARPLVALAVREVLQRDPAASVLIFDDASGTALDFDLRGSAEEVVARLDSAPAGMPLASGEGSARGRGRPRLGVVAREVTLLPRQWDWLAGQPGGASAVLRRLVEAARRADGGQAEVRAARDAAYRFLSAMAGNRPGFEDAIRALYAGDDLGFTARMADWPDDIRSHAIALARNLAWGGE